jgi:hypothetical protein
MALGNVTVNKAQGVGQPTTGKDHYTGFLFYVDPDDYPAGMIRKWAVGLTVVVGDFFEDSTVDHKVYVADTAGTTSGTAATDPLLSEVTDLQELADARAQLVTIANMETLGITEGSNADVIWYQMNYFFEKNPNGFAWLRMADEGLATVSFDEMDDIVLASGGDVRKIGVYNNGSDAVFAAAHATNLQVKYAEYAAAYTPLQIAYFPLSFTEAYGSFIDLKDSGNSYGVWCVNAWDLETGSVAVTGHEYPAMGVVMGNWAISKVSESIGHVRQYDFISSTNGTNVNAEYDKFGFRDSSGLISWATLDGAAGDLLDTSGWNFFRKYAGISGTYLNDMSTVSVEGNDFDKVFYNVTLDKISRNVRTNLLPEINGEIIFNGDGTLSDVDIHRYSNLSNAALAAMQSAGEISAYETVIDRTQDVASTGILYVTVNVVLNGVAKSIIVSLARVNALG